MQLSRISFSLALLLSPIALIGTTWLYLYPLLHGCAFPSPPLSSSHAPFRLLALGDPQLEGDSSLPNPDDPILPSLQFLVHDVRNAGSWSRGWSLIQDAAKGVPKDLGRWAEGLRKSVDLWGNDLYLAHIVRSLRWWTRPTHVSVLGDLLGSQWVTDGEFERRSTRFWGTVFRGMERVEDGIMGARREGEEESQELDSEKQWGGTVEMLGQDKSWENRVINIAGNHDIGYAGDIDSDRIARFEKAFGKVNWDITFTLPNTTSPEPPALRILVLNSMNLDTPAYSSTHQRHTYDFLNHIITTSRSVNDKTHSTIMLTHIPLLKEPGLCVDSPFFDFFSNGAGVKEQNMLSDHASKVILEGVYGLNSNPEADGTGLGRKGIILNGHDHAGCDVLHWIRQQGVEYNDFCPQLPPPVAQAGELHRPSDFGAAAAGFATWNATTAEEDADSEMYTTTNDTSDADADSSSSLTPENEPTPPEWKALRYPPSTPYQYMDDDDLAAAAAAAAATSAPQQNTCIPLDRVPRMREITLRSMMGDYSGYAGFLSAWFDVELGERGEWVLEFSTCGVGVQHWWWGVHIVDVVVLVAVVLGCGGRVFCGESSSSGGGDGGGKRVDSLRRAGEVDTDARGER